ncbi:hypothetical protein [Saccharopolyspora karakumensis]|uniref:hypothetical protein n=1 Tax=Saccharopolyspora karakumensis TaxID=2530386 RepID=UPI001A9D0026|nr:hypothetical protein [Saccharopolyspora karakumensis]
MSTPKLAFTDTGVACHLLGQDVNSLAEPGGSVGAVLVGDRFVAGYVLYTGQQTLPFGDKVRAVPMDALWRLRP